MKRILFLVLTGLLALLLTAGEAQARTQIAFLKLYDFYGNLVQYEPGSQFAHTALRIGDLWLQSYPQEGVKLITWEELNRRGVVSEVITISGTITYDEIAPYLGRPFDFGYTWSDEALYCSELLAKILHIKPEPMELNRDVWPETYWHLEGKPGISPDDLYRRLKTPGPYL